MVYELSNNIFWFNEGIICDYDVEWLFKALNIDTLGI